MNFFHDMNIEHMVKRYDTSHLTIAVLGSHSALDVCRGAKDEGFRTLVVCEKGREKTYDRYYRTQKETGCVDECLILDRYDEILKPEIQLKLINKNCIFVPHRSFEVYTHFNYPAIEKKFRVPVFGNRYLLKIEERGVRPNQYDVLEKAGIRMPVQFPDPKKIDRLVFVKVLEEERGFERAFFLAESYEDYRVQADNLIKKGVISSQKLECAVIEEFILGAQVNLNYFYSPVSHRLELMGTDTRRQTNVEGLLKIPSLYQNEIVHKIRISYEESGHIAVTVLESMLERVFEIGERFVSACRKLYPPGIIGPFALQSIIVPGPPKKDFVVVDVSPRMPGSPGIASTPYSGYLYNKPMSSGRRIASELHHALSLGSLSSVIT